jgi:hypothetical protein
MATSPSDIPEESLNEEEIASIGAYLLLMTYPTLEMEQTHNIIRDKDNEITD